MFCHSIGRIGRNSSDCQAKGLGRLSIDAIKAGRSLANERYGEFLLSVRDDKEGAACCIEKAIQFYQEWGAVRKVDLLRKQHF